MIDIDKKFCCWCEEILEVEQGSVVWVSKMDGSVGHKNCIEKYDEEKQREPAYNTQKRIEIIRNIQRNIIKLEMDLENVCSDVSKRLISTALLHYKRQLTIAKDENYAADIEKIIKFYQLTKC